MGLLRDPFGHLGVGGFYQVTLCNNELHMFGPNQKKIIEGEGRNNLSKQKMLFQVFTTYEIGSLFLAARVSIWSLFS